MSWDPDEPFPSSAALGETDSGARNLAEFLCSLLAPGPVLAIGSSETALRAAREHEVITLDWNHRRLHRLTEAAREQGIEIRAVCRDPHRQELGVASGGVPNIVCVDVLERAPSDLALLQKLRRALSPGGTLVARVPACEWIRSEAGATDGPVRCYDESTLREVLLEAGFAVRRLRRWNLLGVSSALLWDRVLGRPHRYRGGTPCAERPRNRLDAVLDGWYRQVEDRLAFPLGVSLVAVAHPEWEHAQVKGRVLAKGLAGQRPEACGPLSLRRILERSRGAV